MNKKGKMIGQGNTAEIYEWGEKEILKLYREGLPLKLCENEFNKTKAPTVSRGWLPSQSKSLGYMSASSSRSQMS